MMTAIAAPLRFWLVIAEFDFEFEGGPTPPEAAAIPAFELMGLATEVVVNWGVLSSVGKMNGGLAVSADRQKDEKSDSASATFTVDRKPIRAGSDA